MLELLGAVLTVIVSYEVCNAAGLLTVFFIGAVLAVLFMGVRGK